MLISGDFDPALRAAFPAAVRAALDGDRAPLLRLGRRSFSVEGEPPPPQLISTALFTATTCEEMRLPWPRTTPPDPAQRRLQAEAAAAAMPGARLRALRPRHPARERPAAAVRPLAGVPVRAGVRARPAAGRAGAAPGGRGRPAHAGGGRPRAWPRCSRGRSSWWRPPPATRCSGRTGRAALQRAFASFFRGQPVRTGCRRCPREFPPSPPPPTALRKVPPARGVSGVRGRALTALALTLRDVGEDSLTRFILDERDPDLARGGGLRGGRYRIDGHNRLHLSGVVLVPGVRVERDGQPLRRAPPARAPAPERAGHAGRRAGTARARGERAPGRQARSRGTLSARASTSSLQAVAAGLPGPR